MANSTRAVARKFVLSAGVAALLLGAGVARSESGIYLRIWTQEGSLDGVSQERAHQNWIPVTSIVSANLDGDALGDRGSSGTSTSDSWSAAANKSNSAKGASGSTGKAATGSNQGAVSTSSMSERDVGTGQASGKRQHKPLVITKEWDASSPKLFEMHAHSTVIQRMELDLGHSTQFNKTGHYLLTDVKIVSMEGGGAGESQDALRKAGPSGLEKITFTYQKIEFVK